MTGVPTTKPCCCCLIVSAFFRLCTCPRWETSLSIRALLPPHAVHNVVPISCHPCPPLRLTEGPLRLDLGDVLYAPNTIRDAKGRQVLWGWLQERREGGDYGYAGCMSVPRVVTIKDGRVHQEPIPELRSLRKGKGLYQRLLHVPESQGVPLQSVGGRCLDIDMVLERGTASAAGLQLRAYDREHGDAAVVVDWVRGTLEVVVEVPGGTSEVERRVGGAVGLGEEDQITMRVLLDHSCLEVRACGPQRLDG